MRFCRFLSCVALAALSFLPSLTLAAIRTCTDAEAQAANARLFAIQADVALTDALIARHVPLGLPPGAQPSQGGKDNEFIMTQGGYVMQHDQDLLAPVWASYQLTRADVDGAGPDVVNCFRSDPRLGPDVAADPSDYNEPLFDQGHLANSADFNDEVTEQVNAFVMTNISPQYCRFNRGVWHSMELLGRKWAQAYDSIYILSGAIFDYDAVPGRDADSSVPRMQSRNGKSRVAIPSGYYKVFLRQDGATWHALSFVFAHNDDAHGSAWVDVQPDVEAARSTVEAIERATDQVLFPGLERSAMLQNDAGAWDVSLAEANSEDICN